MTICGASQPAWPATRRKIEAGKALYRLVIGRVTAPPKRP
jgi:hypothetical protein